MLDETHPYIDYDSILYTPQQAAELLGLTSRTLKIIEDDNDLEIRRVSRGSVSARVYTPEDLFKIASIRRSKGSLKPLPAPVTISVYVQKGGTAKTTTTVNLAIHFALNGLRTLIIDNDPQGDASTMLGYDPDLMPEELEELGIPRDRAVDGHFGNLIGSYISTSQLFPGRTLDEVIKKPLGEHGPHLIPAETTLDDLINLLNTSTNRDFRYLTFLEKARKGLIPGCDLSAYDIILFDNAPSGSILTTNSIVASDVLVCPVRMDKFSFRALIRLSEMMRIFAEDFKRAPLIAAIPTMFIKNRPRVMYNLARLNTLFPSRVTEEKLYFSEDYSKALDDGIPMILWKGASANSVGVMRKAFDEILDRIRSAVG